MKSNFIKFIVLLLIVLFFEELFGLKPCEMSWPTGDEKKITSERGSQYDGPNTIRKTHKGIDIDLRIGDPVSAAADGTVKETGFHKTYGNYILIEHEDGIETLYAHLSEIRVEPKQSVKKGKVIRIGWEYRTRYRG